MTVVALNRELRRRSFWTDTRPEPDLLWLLHVVALGTVADDARLSIDGVLSVDIADLVAAFNRVPEQAP